MLTIEDRGPVRWLTLDRPERLNAIPPDGWAALAESFDDFAAAEQRVLVVTGAGGAFCSGADLSAADASSGLGSHVERYERMQNVATAASALHRLTKPTVAAVDGVAVGAGMNLALGCDLVIASSRARFAEIFVRRGLSVDFGGTWLLPRIVGLQRAKELALTGRMVEAAEAREIGMVLEVVEPDELEASVQRLAEELAAGAPLAQAFIKRGLDRSLGSDVRARCWRTRLRPRPLSLGRRTLLKGSPPFSGDETRPFPRPVITARLGATLLLAGCLFGHVRAARSRSSPTRAATISRQVTLYPNTGRIPPRAGLTPRCGRAAGSMRSRYPTWSRSTISSTGWLLSSTIRISPKTISTALRGLAAVLTATSSSPRGPVCRRRWLPPPGP